MKDRDISLDIVKGWLIFCLVLHHLANIGLYKVGYADNPVLKAIELIGEPLYACYFMQTFFVISGMCTSFNKPFKSFLTSQFKGFLVPVICFTFVYQLYYCGPGDFFRIVKQIIVYGGDFWFLYAMFFCKVFYYLLYRFSPRRWLLSLLLMLCLCGTLLNELSFMPNYFWHTQILDFIFFIGVGHLYKDRINNSSLLKAGSLYFIVVAIAFVLCGKSLPMVTAGFHSSLLCWPIHILLSSFGTVAVIALAKRVKADKLMVYVGQRSMIVFIIQVYANGYFLHLFRHKLISGMWAESVIAVLVMLCSIVSIALFVEYLLDKSFLRVMLGKKFSLFDKITTPPPISLNSNISTLSYSFVS